jgi:hypothetical protein
MNERITKLFCVCTDNRVITIETNFKEFYSSFKKIEPHCKSDRWYINRFKIESEFSHVINDKIYYFQQLV